MARSRALLTLSLAATLIVTAVGPVGAATCVKRCACPMMAKLRAMPCHAGAALAAPMDCCRRAVPPANPAPTVAAPAGPEIATLPVDVSVPAPPPPASVAAPAALGANQHQLGLFTLHSIWRI